MKNIIKTSFQFLLSISIFECLFIAKSSKAFFPKINEPSQQELNKTAIQIGKTAIQLIKFGQNDEAIKLLELAVKLNPNEPDLWIGLAEAQIRLNKKYKALTTLNKAIELQPKQESIYFTKASLYMDLGEHLKARTSVINGLSINKNNAKGYFQLGNTEIMLNNFKSAIIAFKKSSKIDSTFWQSINNEGLILYELDKPKEALKKFKSALKISKDAEPMLALAIVLFSIDNESHESFNLAKNALESNPRYVSNQYQTKQLWGKKLQKSGQLLFKRNEMKKVVIEAKEKNELLNL